MSDESEIESAEEDEVILISTQPPAKESSILLEHFETEIVKQNDRLDELAKQLFTLELAVPSVYVIALQIVWGEKATVAVSTSLTLMFVFWFFALVLTMVALFPLRYQVPREIVYCDAEIKASFWDTLGRWITQKPIQCSSIDGFYQRSASDKRRALMLAGLCFFIGLIFAVFTIVFRG